MGGSVCKDQGGEEGVKFSDTSFSRWMTAAESLFVPEIRITQGLAPPHPQRTQAPEAPNHPRRRARHPIRPSPANISA